MTASLPPGALLILGGLALPLLPPALRKAWMLALPVLGAVQLWLLPDGASLPVECFGLTLELLRADRLSVGFAWIFHLAALLSVVYALALRDTMQHVAALVYAGSAIGALFAGDLVTLFVYWELTAISSVFLVWASRNERAYHAGMRYLLVQVGSGLLLLGGLIVHYVETGSIAFDELGLGTLGTNLIFLAFGIKCAFPLLHNWLQDAYPQATATGAVFLSSFTTKLAIYALARGYAGTELLIGIGAVMTVFPIVYAAIENDLRRVLAYAFNIQLGFMVVGIGVGTELALNGTVAHAFGGILYKALLFMALGAVLVRAGTVNGSELGGLYRSMPLTAAFCIVGAASISAFPLSTGFVSKALILSAAAHEGHLGAWLAMLFASAGVFYVAGIKIPFVAFFGRDGGIRVREAPPEMLVAMGATASLCIAIGVYPASLYAMLPFDITYAPYTLAHVVAQLQLLAFSALAFAVMRRRGIHPPQVRSTNLDSDWIYRKLLPQLGAAALAPLARVWEGRLGALLARGQGLFDAVYRHHGPHGVLSRTWPTGSMALWVAVILALALVLHYL